MDKLKLILHQAKAYLGRFSKPLKRKENQH